ncbi:TPA: hypothetical protein NHR53_005608 [Pseudomonas aeruginosa]|nr:hypothetical protein [Pseudomonas aeruginosa]HCE8129022.1 hypothetical protein [Pseudomonas aeruginosa]HCF0446809.1 hypothetical protein [Pseudomonas aeruginosa]
MNEANSDKGPIKGCIAEVIKAARAAPAIYFAPLVGAFTGVALQWKKLQPQPLAKPKLA